MALRALQRAALALRPLLDPLSDLEELLPGTALDANAG